MGFLCMFQIVSPLGGFGRAERQTIGFVNRHVCASGQL